VVISVNDRKAIMIRTVLMIGTGLFCALLTIVILVLSLMGYFSKWTNVISIIVDAFWFGVFIF